uniref:zinc-finger homeodomain protein 6-like n=1 Tax=Erigeron canadensis TaxID=72917 RepID=UPI001CB94971|nr:zinc-finger homeodomain protein 6-like [Erigeron canadensis]
MDARDRKTINHNNPSQSNQDSPSIFTYAPLNSSNITRNQTPDQQRNYYNVFQDQQMEANRETRESNPYPFPDPDPVSQTPPPPLDTTPIVRYRECLKNHAASIGTHAVDGCGEFMPNGEEGTPESLKCAACECHRSFHRREVDGEPQPTAIIHNQQQPQPSRVAAAATMQPPHSYRYSHGHMQPMMVAFGGTSNVAQTESSSEDLDMFRTHTGQQPSKKRFRTKFSEEQKEKMHDFAEKIGWRIQKQDEEEILQFCNEVGLKRKVFKVWMHNCKQASKKKQE